MGYNDLLLQTCTIYRKTTTVGTRGEVDVTWVAVETNVKCNIQIEYMVREDYAVGQGGERSVTSYSGYFKYGANIREGDKVVVSDNREFHVDRVGLDTVGHKHHIEADLEIL